MRKKGKISSWNDGKGYGFISPFEGGKEVFAHIKAFGNRGLRPVVGDVVTFSMGTDARGRPCAKGATISGVSKKVKAKKSRSSSNVIAVVFLLMVAGAVLVSAIPISILLCYFVASTLTFGAYALDKSAAQRGGWRTSESTLHFLALFGGWPGALIAQNRLRHKSKKQTFRAIFWATVVLNCAVFIWMFSAKGANTWEHIIYSIFSAL